MIKTINADELLTTSFSCIIDVRSPNEFLESHIPNALNFFVLNNEQFAQIGTLYKEDSFRAKVVGASFVTQNISKHLNALSDIIHPKMPFLIHCARGGMRSKSFALVLDSIGYRVCLLDGGYKSYRKMVTNYLQGEIPHKFITIVGQSGCGKSEIIRVFNDSLDLEGLANHLGSSFGGIFGSQPSVKDFQNMLFTRLKTLENAPFVLVEGESKKIGNLVLPSNLYKSYQNSPKILITASLESRIQRIYEQYGAISAEFFESSMQKISPFIKKDALNAAKSAFYAGDLLKVAEILLVEYYDKVYKKEQFSHCILHTNIKDTIAQIREFANKIYT